MLAMRSALQAQFEEYLRNRIGKLEGRLPIASPGAATLYSDVHYLPARGCYRASA